MPPRNAVCWVLFPEYVRDWSARTFASSCILNGRVALNLDACHEAAQILREPLVMNADMKMLSPICMSAQLANVLFAANEFSKDIIINTFGEDAAHIDEFQPVMMPSIALVGNIARDFNDTMQMRNGQAQRLVRQVCSLFKREILRYDEAYRQSCRVKGARYSTEEMLDEYILHNHLQITTYASLLRDIFRLKAANASKKS